MIKLTHLFTYWPPGSNPTPVEKRGRLAFNAAQPRQGVPTGGGSMVYCGEDVFAVGGIVAEGSHATIPTTAREVLEPQPRTNRRGTRTLYAAKLSDYDGSALFDTAEVWRKRTQDDGMGGVIEEPELLETVPCTVTPSPAEDTQAMNERVDDRWAFVALKDAPIQEGDSLYITNRGVYLNVTGTPNRPPQSLFLSATLEVSDESYPGDL